MQIYLGHFMPQVITHLESECKSIIIIITECFAPFDHQNKLCDIHPPKCPLISSLDSLDLKWYAARNIVILVHITIWFCLLNAQNIRAS